jgi:MFS family permease
MQTSSPPGKQADNLDIKISSLSIPDAEGDPEIYPSPSYAWYVVFVLTVAYVFSFIDRQILSLLVEPIRRDLGINDTQMSLLMGFSFAVFYTFFGIPMGRLADVCSRRAIIAAGIIFWSVMTALCGLARNFGQFMLVRMGVGVGEATLSPSAYSLIADYFPKENRATAISVYSMGIYLGSGLASLLGGLVIRFASAQGNVSLPMVREMRPWQVIFLLLGISGVAFSAMMLTVREPLRRGLQAARQVDGAVKATGTSLSTVMEYLRKNRRTFLCHNLGFALIALAGYSSSSWIPTVFIRRFGWSASQAGIVYGALVMIFGTLGIVIGGRLADHLRQRGYRDANMRVGMIATLAWLPGGILYCLVPSALLAAVCLVPAIFFIAMPFGVAPAAIQEMMPNEMRGQASAIYLFVISLIGLGIGPTAVAMMTDYVFRSPQSLYYSMLMVNTAAQIIAAALLFAGLKPFVKSLDYLQQWQQAQSLRQPAK